MHGGIKLLSGSLKLLQETLMDGWVTNVKHTVFLPWQYNGTESDGNTMVFWRNVTLHHDIKVHVSWCLQNLETFSTDSIFNTTKHIWNYYGAFWFLFLYMQIYIYIVFFKCSDQISKTNNAVLWYAAVCKNIPSWSTVVVLPENTMVKW